MSTVLRSDHVNYLIWRYLQEHGYGRSAVQLMRDWHDNPQELPFASSVKDHTLVSILQDGLTYDNLQSSVAKNGLRYSFMEVKMDDRKRPASSEFDNSNDTPQGSVRGPRKKPRLGINGTNGLEEAHSRSRPKQKRAGSSKRQAPVTEDAMNIDGDTPSRMDEDNDVPTEEAIVEPEPVPVIITTAQIGSDAIVQTEKIPEKPIVKSICDLRIPGADIVHLEWHASDSTRLSAAGGSVWRSWTIPTSQVTSNETLQPEFEDSGPPVKEFYVTATAKSPANRGVAMAIEQGDQRTLVLGNHTSPLSWHDQSTVLAFRWDPSSDLLLAASVSVETGGIVSVWKTEKLEDMGDFSPMDAPLDACWTKDSHFIVCGENFIDLYSVADSIKLVSNIATELPWEKVKYDGLTQNAALSSSRDGQIGFIDLSTDFLQCELTAAHDSQITALEWQPMGQSLPDDQPRILGSSSEDGTVKLWDARKKPVCLHVFELEPSVPIMCMRFSPDGLFLAAGGDKLLNIWKAQPEGQLTAMWSASHPRIENQDSNGVLEKTEVDVDMDIDGPEQVDEPYHTLSWNSEGLKLAYGCGDQVHVIDLRR